MATPRSLASSPFNNLRVPQPPPAVFVVGQRVTHDRHGLGRVVGLEGEVAVLVDFGDRVVRVAAGSARLHAL
ncbi:hypothetical protein EXU48_00340 [Occultella glacieicola]|uniref:DUF3553 domain-containing protein n=1 Tax=Occultella glacieicola TaxID=2518684 RepID=A0ABY2E886_9MICO|nr:hypothetical protein [Occultella glacieicola]TDE98702.1 hypothetical protein EXU48_00340 [Occultella glacieicola]